MHVDQLRAMKVFTSVVELGSFSRAADRLELSRPMVSHIVAQLETQLRTRLLQRTTRRLALTDEGSEYFRRCIDILLQVEEAGASVSDASSKPRGTLRLNTAPATVPFLGLDKVVTEYLARYPLAGIQVTVADHHVNLVEEGIDLALRIAEVVDPGLVARKIARVRMVACAAPAYLREHGAPRHPTDLTQHQCLTFPLGRMRNHWDFRRGKEHVTVPVAGRLRAGGGLLLASAALHGLGIVGEPEPAVFRGLQDGTLVHVLPDWELPTMYAYAVYPKHRHLPAKVQAFIDLLREHVQDPPYWEQRPRRAKAGAA